MHSASQPASLIEQTSSHCCLWLYINRQDAHNRFLRQSLASIAKDIQSIGKLEGLRHRFLRQSLASIAKDIQSIGKLEGLLKV